MLVERLMGKTFGGLDYSLHRLAKAPQLHSHIRQLLPDRVRLRGGRLPGISVLLEP